MKQRPELSSRQEQIYAFIVQHLERRGVAPSIREIGDAVGLKSPNAVFKHLKALEELGFIERTKGAARNISLPALRGAALGFETARMPRIPLADRVPQDDIDQLREHPIAYIVVDPYFLGDVPPGDCVIVRADDDALAADGISRGDFLIVREGAPQNDRPVVVISGEAVLVRRLVGRPPASQLVATDPAATPLRLRDVAVIGPLVASLRRYRGR